MTTNKDNSPADASDWWTNKKNEIVVVNGVRKRLGDCTADDVRVLAAQCRADASKYAREAADFRATAARMRATD